MSIADILFKHFFPQENIGDGSNIDTFGCSCHFCRCVDPDCPTCIHFRSMWDLSISHYCTSVDPDCPTCIHFRSMWDLSISHYCTSLDPNCPTCIFRSMWELLSISL